MITPSTILENKKIKDFLIKRKLLKQYKNSKEMILKGKGKFVNFKKREPKQNDIWYFRINDQYRALCIFDDIGDLIVFKIDDHQN